MQHEREKWKDDVLRSIHGIQRPKPDPELYDRILAKVERARHIRQISMRRVYMMAAGLAILLALNLWAITNLSPQQAQQPRATNGGSYELSNANFQLY